MNGVQKFKNAMNFGYVYQRWMYYTCRYHKIEHKYLNGNIWPKLFEAPEPSLILWENVGARLCNRITRATIIHMCFLAIIVIGLYALSIADNYIE
jgi:hypothetical protein